MNKVNDCLEIYRQSFGEDDRDFENLLFENCSSCLETLEVDGETVSFLFALPCEIRLNEQNLKATYIFAAATHSNHRKKGYMAKLLEKVKKKNDSILILRPANASLIEYYKKSGFSVFTCQDKENNGISLAPTKEFKALAEKTEKTSDGEFTAMFYNSNLQLNGLYFPYSMP